MTPAHIEHLANLADPDELWRLNPFGKFTPEQARQLETGIALRRYAAHVRQLEALHGTFQSLLITPLSPNGTRVRVVPTPP